jgi:hypothetical protein
MHADRLTPAAQAKFAKLEQTVSDLTAVTQRGAEDIRQEMRRPDEARLATLKAVQDRRVALLQNTKQALANIRAQIARMPNNLDLVDAVVETVTDADMDRLEEIQADIKAKRIELKQLYQAKPGLEEQTRMVENYVTTTGAGVWVDPDTGAPSWPPRTNPVMGPLCTFFPEVVTKLLTEHIAKHVEDVGGIAMADKATRIALVEAALEGLELFEEAIIERCHAFGREDVLRRASTSALAILGLVQVAKKGRRAA